MRNHDTGFPVRTNYEALIGHLSTPQYNYCISASSFLTVCRSWEEAKEKQNREKKRHKKLTTALSIPSSSFMLYSAHWAEMTCFLASIVIDAELWPSGTGEVIHHVRDPRFKILSLTARLLQSVNTCVDSRVLLSDHSRDRIMQ